MFTWGALPASFLAYADHVIVVLWKSGRFRGWLERASSPAAYGEDQSRDGYVIWLNPCSPENVARMQILGVAFIRVNASEEGPAWAEGKCPQAVGREESSCQRPCEVSSITQTPPGQSLPSQYSSLLHASTVYALYRVFWRVRPEALHNLFLLTEATRWPSLSPALLNLCRIFITYFRIKESVVWKRSLQSWREGILMLPNFAGMKQHCKEVGESVIFVLWSHLGHQMSTEAPVWQIQHEQRADAAGVLALVMLSSSSAIKGTAKCKIETHKKYRKLIIHTRITHGKTTLS